MVSEQIIKEFNASENTLSFEAMKFVVESQQARMRKKGRVFNCEVLERTKHPENSFLTFLRSLPNKDNFRTQFIYLSALHWSCGDVFIEKGKIRFFLFDAANSLYVVFLTILDILKTLPDSTLYYCGPGIQKTLSECAYYAIDNALALSKNEKLHEELAKVDINTPLGPFKTYGEYIRHMFINDPNMRSYISFSEVLELIDYIKPVPILAIPQSFGSLFKNMQSIEMYNKLVAPRSLQLHNGKPLKDYLETHTKVVEDKPQLRGLDHKMAKIKNVALEYQEQQREKVVERNSELPSADHSSSFPNFLTLHFLNYAEPKYTAPKTSKKDTSENEVNFSKCSKL